MRISDWSSDVCSSDLPPLARREALPGWSQSCPKGYRSFRTDLFGFVGFLRFQDFEDERDGLIYRERCLRVVVNEDIGLARDRLAKRDRKSTRLNSSH